MRWWRIDNEGSVAIFIKAWIQTQVSSMRVRGETKRRSNTGYSGVQAGRQDMTWTSSTGETGLHSKSMRKQKAEPKNTRPYDQYHTGRRNNLATHD